ncbi:MAG TPA: cupin domain-containing protein [Dehalococcoidia bacterium]|nr:cupin domain-containing protein [Dehalococcoidia bacterium]
MKDMGEYEILSHVAMPECSIRIIGMRETEQVSLHYHQNCTQIYTVLEHEVEARVGERTFRLRPYETVRIEKGTPHGVRAVDASALVLSLSIPPLERDDQHVVE